MNKMKKEAFMLLSKTAEGDGIRKMFILLRLL